MSVPHYNTGGSQNFMFLLQVPSTQASAPQQVYLDLNVDGQPKGRLVIQLDGEAPVGTKRFADLSKGLNGVGYRLSKFDGIAQVAFQLSSRRHVMSRSDTCMKTSCRLS